jgi:hypothetical protein
MKRNNCSCYSLIALGFISIMIPQFIAAQKGFKNDPNYYETFPNKLTTRIYLSQKFTQFDLPALAKGEDIDYVVNSKLNLGIGVTWHNYSLNIFNGFSFLNKSNESKGKTRGLNLQLHLFPGKWAIDVLGVFPRGHYLASEDYRPTPTTYYYRPDVELVYTGISAYIVPNKERFSYRAAIIQNEWQKKSAGSFLFGGEAYYGKLGGDSALVPSVIQNEFSLNGVQSLSFSRIAPGAGGAYSLVIKKHFFIMGSLVGNLGLNFFNEENAGSKNKKTSVSPSIVYKGAIGYNSKSWNISANLTGNEMWMKGSSSNKNYLLPAGHVRFVISRKIDLKKHS